MAITATAARKDLYRLLEAVNQDNDEIEITSKSGSAFLVCPRVQRASRNRISPSLAHQRRAAGGIRSAGS
jgi:prevent-host-death family protein